MPKFIRAPVPIDAVQWDGNVEMVGEPWFHSALLTEPGTLGNLFIRGETVLVTTMLGVMTADPGDWIVRDEMGAFCPVKPDVFWVIYQPALHLTGNTIGEISMDVTERENQDSNRALFEHCWTQKGAS